MGYLIAAIFAYFRAKPFTHIFLACVFVALGVGFYTLSMKMEQDKAAALASPMPAAVSLSAFGDDDIHLADEINVIAQINPAYNYELTKEGKSYDTVRYMHVLFGPDDTAETKVARAAVILTEAQIDTFTAMIATNFVDFTEMGPVFSVNGEADSSPDLKSMANEAIAKEGLTKAPDFIFIEPWLEGRAVALAPGDLGLMTTSKVIASPALLSVLLAFFGFQRARRQTSAARHMAATPIPAALMGTPRPTTPAMLIAQVGSHAAAATRAPAELSAAASRAPMSRGKKIRFGILGAVVLLIVTKQFWVFALVPVVAVLSLDRGMRKIAKQTFELAMALIDKTATPESPAPQPAPAPAIAPQAPAMPAFAAKVAAKPAAKPLPPAIRPGFAFRDLLPKRREAEPEENPYTSLAASIRDERLRRSGA
jgi:hypothetical protein